VPDYLLFDIGGYLIAKKTFGNLDISGGIRYDTRTEHGEKLTLDTEGRKTNLDSAGYIHKFADFNMSFSGVSGSIGVAYQFSKKTFGKLNFSRGFRAPNIAELAANGEHEGTNRYETGDSKLNPENSLEIDAAFGMNTEHLTVELDLFDNRIQNFIYQRKLSNVQGGDSLTDGLQTFRFVQGNTNLLGGELSIDIHPHPLDWLHLQNSFSLVEARQWSQPDSTRYLPLIPPAKWRSELKIEKSVIGKYLQNAYFKIDVETYFAQKRYFKAYSTETSTPRYTLVNLGTGGSIVRKKHTYCSLYLSINNLTDKAYQSHLSRLKYAGQNVATGRNGVFNMGRNVSVKMIFPFTLRGS
jgi:iron complex outermembrane receptor protein